MGPAEENGRVLLLHAIALGAPFGGVGRSDLGSYHKTYGSLAISPVRPHFDTPPGRVDRLVDFCFPPWTPIESKRMNPVEKPTFDRPGNLLSSTIHMLKWSAVTAALSTAVYGFVRHH
jgi:hypothetical protein